MALRHRSAPLPDDVRARLDLARGDKVLAAARMTHGWVVASRVHLHLVEDGAEPVRHPWADVDGARLDPDRSEITLTWVNGRQPSVLELEDARAVDLPRALHERVQSSVVHREVVTLPSGRSVRVVARRDPEGGLLTQVIGDGHVDLDDPGTAAVVDAAEQRVREAVGLT